MKETPEDKKLEYYTRQLESTISAIQFLYSVLLQCRDKGIKAYGVAYLIDLQCTYLMHYYGGDNAIIKEIQAIANKEVEENYNPKPTDSQKTIGELDKVQEELKSLGINYNVLYDPKTKKTFPNVDLNKLGIPEEVIEDWIMKNMDKVLDRYLEKRKKKETKDEKKKAD
jgi:hypothetical protein